MNMHDKTFSTGSHAWISVYFNLFLKCILFYIFMTPRIIQKAIILNQTGMNEWRIWVIMIKDWPQYVFYITLTVINWPDHIECILPWSRWMGSSINWLSAKRVNLCIKNGKCAKMTTRFLNSHHLLLYTKKRPDHYTKEIDGHMFMF